MGNNRVGRLRPAFVRALALLSGMIVMLIAAAPARSDAPAIPRASADRSDQLSDWQIHAVYFVPQGSHDGHLDTNGTLDVAARRMQSWFRRASGGYTWRLDTFGPKRLLDVTFVRGKKTNDQYRSGGSDPSDSVGEELRSRGMEVDETKKRYLVFYAGDTSDSGLCGIAEYPIYGPRQYTPAADEGVKTGGDFAFVLLGAREGCHPQDFGRGNKPGWVQTTMMHELIHTEGLAPPGAPHTCDPGFLLSAGHVCGFGPASLGAPTVSEPIDPERHDVMFPFVNMSLSSKLLDEAGDDYFQTTIATLDLKDSAFVRGRREGSSSTSVMLITPVSVHLHHDYGIHDSH